MKITVVRLLLLTIAYLFAPHLIFILGWVQLGIALPATAALLFLGYMMVKHTQNDTSIGETLTLSKPQILYLLAFCLGLAAFSGIGEMLWQRDDFFKHNLIFSDLLRNNWPVTYTATKEPAMLTYYLGWYMVPAGVGKIAGIGAMVFTSFLWTAMGLGLLFLWLRAVLKTNNFILWVVFLGISGFEFLWVAGHYIYYLFTYYPQYGLIALLKGTVTYTRSELIVPYFTQNIPSFFVGFLSAPQHVLSGFLASAVVVYAITKKLSFRYTAVLVALVVFWSPLVGLGLLPFAVYHLWLDRKQVFFKQNIRFYVFGGVLLFFTISYLLAHHLALQHGFVWQITGSNWLLYALVFIVLKFGIIFLYLLYKDKRLDFIGSYKRLGFISIVCLILMSFYKFGAYNDLIARASIPFYFVMLLWIVFFLQKIRIEPIKKYIVVYGIIGLMLLPRLWQVYKTIAYTPQLKTKKYTIAQVPQKYNILSHNEWLVQVKPEYTDNYVIDNSISQQYLGTTNSFFYKYLAKKEAEK